MNNNMKKIGGLCVVVLFLLFMSGLMSLLVTGRIHWPITIASTLGFLVIIWIVIKLQK